MAPVLGVVLTHEAIHPGTPVAFPVNGVQLQACLAEHERGLFGWDEWAALLGEEIKAAQRAGDPDTGETYYRHWLAALERMVARKGIADPATLARYRDAWDRAADRTPHGAPIALTATDFAAG